MDDKKHLSSLKRGLEALSILNVEGRLTGSELAKRLKIPRTTAHRILETLATEGYVQHDTDNRCFRLSGKVRHIAFGFNRDSLLAEVARPVLQDVCRETLMPVGLTTPVGLQMVVQVSTDHQSPLALERVPEGAAFPLTFGATGHVFLAHCSEEVRNRMMSSSAGMPPGALPPSTEELDRIRREQYAVSPPREGCAEGLIATPVYFKGEYVASLHLRFMRRVMSASTAVQRHLPQLRAAALEIEERLGAMITDMPSLYGRINGPLLVSDSQPQQTSH